LLKISLPGNWFAGIVTASSEAGIAQLVEQLICNQQVIGSNPIAGSSSPSAERKAIRSLQ
jgi:hypothetical protein